MKNFLALLLLCSAMLASAAGPTLGAATDVAVTGTGVDDAESGKLCKEFKLSAVQAGAILNQAVIVTQREIHDYYDFAPCFVRGTANFHGYPATWEIRAGGTGSITLMGGVHLSIVDEKERNVLQ